MSGGLRGTVLPKVVKVTDDNDMMRVDDVRKFQVGDELRQIKAGNSPRTIGETITIDKIEGNILIKIRRISEILS